MRNERERRGAAGGLLLGIALALSAFGCGGASAPKKAAVPDDLARLDPGKARRILQQGEHLVRRGKFEEARKRFDEAEGFATVPVRNEIRAAREMADKKQAKRFAVDINEAAEYDRCQEAIGDTLEVAQRGEVIAGFIRGYVGEEILRCVKRMAKGEKLAEARKLLDGGELKKALDARTYRKLHKKVVKIVKRGVKRAVKRPLREAEWAEAVERINALVKAGRAGDKERARVLEVVREGITDEVATLHREAMGQKGQGAEEIARIDALIALGWPKDATDKRTLAVPPQIVDQRAQLALWVSCDSVKCEASAPTPMWAYGHAALYPVHDPQGAPLSEKIRSGTPVWQIATARKLTLVALKDPGQLGTMGERARHASGWIESAKLKPEDTSKWLPPGDSVIGTRVWGPLREGQKLYELGYVVKTHKAKLTVRRMADRKEVELPRAKVHFGITDHGLKVMAYCAKLDKLTPALIFSVKEVQHDQLGDPLVKLTCLDDRGQPMAESKEGQLASVRIKPAWLPPRR